MRYAFKAFAKSRFLRIVQCAIYIWEICRPIPCWMLSRVGKISKTLTYCRGFSKLGGHPYTCIVCWLGIGRGSGIDFGNCIWLERCIVGDWVKIIFLPSSLYPWMMSLDFLYGVSVPLPLTSLTILELNIRIPPCFASLYFSNEHTPLPMRPSIFWVPKASNGSPGVVILRSLRSCNASSVGLNLLLNSLEQGLQRVFACLRRLLSQRSLNVVGIFTKQSTWSQYNVQMLGIFPPGKNGKKERNAVLH